ncbi:hypothetical protein PV416_36560 [Streptomyces ipomoeae]|uniref:rhomboid-like protein n=1 Tax=Streptomyces ipomoeae TaxID=103232 RepID=UPI0029A0B6E6|nr:rhomboid-like protein [Streptomyces ipomoeae]MDX2826436.1 hypothetical protein [Streptomyces ipomoeae]MDX2876804.1 hypothetical protein [Streptomyces ipomoeae]
MGAVDRTSTAEQAPSVTGPVLDGIPRQPGTARPSTGPAPADPASARTCPAPVDPTPAESGRRESKPARLRPWRLLPTPKGAPFTFSYATVLVVTSIVAEYADPTLVHALHQGSSTDVAHLVQNPMPVLFASALWIAGGVGSPYALGLLLVLTALERRVGGWRTAAVFLSGHVLATLATEIPVGFAVAAGHLPESSLHRLDYGISFGVAASVGALAGLLSPWLRWPVLVLFGGMLVDDLITFSDPMTDWGHLISLAIGVVMWPVVRWWRAARDAGDVEAGLGADRARPATTAA